MNSFIKTILLLGILSVLVVTFGRILGGQSGMVIALMISLAMNVGTYFFSDKLALAMSRAKPLAKDELPEVWKIVAHLSEKMNIPMPKLYVTPDQQANAFATGRDPKHASVAVTEGIVRILSKSELEGVLAHELAHVKNRDILIASVAAVLASMISYLAHMSLFSSGSDDEDRGNPLFGIIGFLVIPIAATLLQLAISRQREFGADESGAKVLGDGKPLAHALVRIEESARAYPISNNPALSSLYISNPLGGLGRGFSSLFSTHPKTEERVKRLLAK